MASLQGLCPVGLGNYDGNVATTTAVTGTRTIARLWQDAVARGLDSPAYLVQEGEVWRPVSWTEAAEAVDEIAHGLLALGVRKGDAFAILASTRVEWVLFDFALALIGAVGAPIYMNNSPKDAVYVAEHSEAVGVLCEDEAQRAKLAGLDLEHVLTFADLPALRERGRAHAAEFPRAVDEAAATIDENDLFTFIYTSGTTGPPKACMILHRNYYAMVDEVRQVQDFTVTDDLMLLYLPLAHNFGRCLTLLGAHIGYTIAFCPDPYAVGDVLPTIRPTVFPSVPRVFEKVHTAVTAKFDEATGAKRRLIAWALRVGRRVSKLREAGRSVPPLLALQHRLADLLVYSKVKSRLGGNLRIGVSGGAPLAKEIIEFFAALDVIILEGYGLTECTTGATINRPTRYRFGTVGPALPGVELRVADDGEVLIKTDTVFGGYFKDEEATREILSADGWLRSGDVGHLDEDGFLTITDRLKDILVTAGGKNVAPQNLENALKTHAVISQALVVGDRRPYVAALITLSEEVDPADAAPAVQRAVDEVNSDLSRYEQIKRFTVLPRDFTLEAGEVTPTLKLKRRVCKEHFAAEIEELYS
ncbi:MAG: long-chain fatty acid--CoA ligase [Actinobacteria bacterium]|nr:MAG: long-chain fatty acid--CoA ligase [Actinomycetota bacterium]TML84700.1 MAG: long-chain fatty acid--CoA ligase [Actinomycetota bacterium]